MSGTRRTSEVMKRMLSMLCRQRVESESDVSINKFSNSGAMGTSIGQGQGKQNEKILTTNLGLTLHCAATGSTLALHSL